MSTCARPSYSLQSGHSVLIHQRHLFHPHEARNNLAPPQPHSMQRVELRRGMRLLPLSRCRPTQPLRTARYGTITLLPEPR